MTISKDSSSPLVVIVGATGKQGTSVFRALGLSDRAYRVRALTRDASKLSAQFLAEKGAEVVSVDLKVGNEDAIKKAFEGANIAFIVTNFWEHTDMQREIDEGNLLISTVVAAGASLVIWSGLESAYEVSRGKYAAIAHVDGKAQITATARKLISSTSPETRLVNVQAGWYATNFHSDLGLGPTKEADGSYVVKLPCSPATKVPMIDIPHDYGMFVRAVIEAPPDAVGPEVLTASEVITFEDMFKQLSEGTGKNVRFVECSREEFEEKLAKKDFPPRIVQELVETILHLSEFDYYGGKDILASQSGLKLSHKPRSWAEFVKIADWRQVLA